MANYIGRVTLLALLYIVTGKLGLLLAVPPGYATVIWPASGIAIGMLIAGGARLWPGVLLGSLLLNAYNSGVFAQEEILSLKLLAAACIAAGSTLQAIVGRTLVARFVGLPLRLNTARDVLWLFALAGPVTCLIAASIGVGTLSGLGIIGRAELLANGIAWWSGDTLGVIVFMPLVLLAPGSRARLTWRAASVGHLPLAALLLLLLPLGLTFYAWKATTENEYQRGQAKFETLTVESEKALQNRLASYGNALLGAAAFIRGSNEVSREEWRTYTGTVQVSDNFPGLNGLGWVEPVDAARLPAFLAAERADGAPDFAIQRPDARGPNYITRLIEPLAGNRAAVGLNIAFESQRRAAAERARDTGEAALTGRVVLLQDEKRSPGFLMMYPVYGSDIPVNSIEGRRAAFRGWTFAPLIASHFLDDLTHSQRSEFRLRVYDGAGEAADALIYDSDPRAAAHPAFSKYVTLPILQREWRLVWESTAEFEQTEHSSGSLFILLGGLLFTALLALLLIVLTVRRTEHIERMVGERRFAVPLLVFAVLATGSVVLHSKLLDLELAFIREQVKDEAGDVERLIRTELNERIASLARMASRWDAAGGTPYLLWRQDAANHVAQLPGLRALEWVDSDYRVRWIEPMLGNEPALGIDVRSDPRRTAALRDAAGHSAATLTRPLDLVQGYTAFVAYLPVDKRGRFDGFIAAAFEVEDFLGFALRAEPARDYLITVNFDGQQYYSNTHGDAAAPESWVSERVIRLQEQPWTVRVSPTPHFLDSQRSMLPGLVLAAGLLVAALAALSVRYILISRLKSAHLAKSLALNAGIISSSAHLVIAIDPQYRIMIFNKAAEAALGYSAAEVTGRRAIPIFMVAAELEARAASLSQELGETIAAGPDIFTRIPLRDGYEKSEWTFVRKNGSRFPVNVIITPLRDERSAVSGFLGVIEDITLAREMERMKSEFTAVVSHELRTPLTSIRGSLGLILGAFAGTLPTKVRDLLAIAQSNCERLMLMINDILDLEKFAAGQMRFEVTTLPLGGVVLQAVEANEGYARKFNVRIDLVACPPDWHVAVDPDRFVQVMANLLSNAAKYSPPGGTVRVWCESRGNVYRVNVHDDGPGIPEEFRGRMFEKFSQADSSTTREKGGSGLGLHIARRFVEHMEGRIGFDSEVGRGSTFWIELPISGKPLTTNI
ncbi:MAG: CHASE domain-containing protein [Pseudomonadota bacterium]